ncbi:MAG: ketose-bisphosphate aldolase [Patescibacteria group bacterium]|jgi:fructose-bisphosphate aldolase class II
MLTTYLDLIGRAYREHWAIGAFNTSNLEITQAIIEAAEELRSPVIVQTSEKAIDYAGLHEIASIVISLASHARVPVVLNLNNGRSYDIAEQCASEGYTGLSRDASLFSLEKNCTETKRVVVLGHSRHIGVEGELGVAGEAEDAVGAQEFFTTPDEARTFVEKTGVDLLVSAAGSAHGYIEGARINIEALQSIRSAVDGIPLALHDSFGLPDRDIVASIRSGVVKITVDTDLRFAFAESLRVNLSEHKTLYDPRGILGPAKDAVKAKVKEKIILFGSSGKA